MKDRSNSTKQLNIILFTVVAYSLLYTQITLKKIAQNLHVVYFRYDGIQSSIADGCMQNHARSVHSECLDDVNLWTMTIVSTEAMTRTCSRQTRNQGKHERVQEEIIEERKRNHKLEAMGCEKHNHFTTSSGNKLLLVILGMNSTCK